MVFSAFFRGIPKKEGEFGLSVYLRFRSAKKATAPIMHTAITAMAIANSVLIKPVAGVSGSIGVAGVCDGPTAMVVAAAELP